MSSDSPIDPVTPPPATPSPQPAPATPPPVAAPVATAYVPVVERKSAALAGFLSMFPGLGHLYLDQGDTTAARTFLKKFVDFVPGAASDSVIHRILH